MSGKPWTAVCLLGLVAFSTACQKNKRAAQPVTTSPPTTSQRPRTHRTPATAAAATTTEASPPAERPRLGQMLTPEQERQYNSEIDSSVNAAEGSLRTISTRRLTPDQQNAVRQIQDLIGQAAETRKVDLAAAKGLAEKARILARDLLKGL